MKEPLLLRVIKSPATITALSMAEWDLLIRQSRAANLISYLGYLLIDEGQEKHIPERPSYHLKSANLITERNAQAVRWEISQLKEALYSLAVPIVLLKGAAYVMAELPISQGRLFHDIDILVPRSALQDVEDRLLQWGWRTTHGSQYDQRYYRTWMHEIPPMKHIKRQTVLDIHHSILPLTASLHPDPRKLLAGAVNAGGEDEVYWLCDVDMILHAATHLFHDGELENGLRDLIDIHCLINGFSPREGFWRGLCQRAGELGLERPLFYALRYAKSLLGLAVPEWVGQRLSSGMPSAALLFLMDALFARALRPDHPSCRRSGTGAARWALYVRSHFLRMPLWLLLPHLLRKALVSQEAEPFPKEVRRFIANNPKR